MPDHTKRLVNAFEPDPIASLDALGVDGEQDLDTVPGPLGYLCRWDTRVEPQRDAAVAQIVRAPGKW
jgi:hypothetical protein